jgi:hypothetical protein
LFQLEPKKFILYYALFTVLALLLFLRRRPRRGMRLRFRGGVFGRGGSMGPGAEPGPGLSGRAGAPDLFSHIEPRGERPLNVMFNYNGHSWDAYEVLGLPAGSSPESVEAAFRESLVRVDATSKAFMEAAFQAIQSQWRTYRAAVGDGRGGA